LPENYFPYALAMSSTHDQPPIISFWKAKDLELFFENGLLLSEEQFFDMLEKRVDARKKLVEAMNKAQTWETQSKTYELSLEEEKGEKVPEGLTKAVIAFMSKTKSFMYMPRLVELCKMNEMENVPGTNDFYSNWRVKTKLDIDEIEKDNFIKQAVEILNNRKE
jgi:4-alpha-glucanotransferase